ncbi:hypothetical protein V9T40_013410 [Parthenolecanium corni]|uniref:Uncharacterized protein n=1 Tax=Parthenolecanium corni TaxID=536013 RepID=A0AAN9TJ26_9HEMI
MWVEKLDVFSKEELAEEKKIAAAALPEQQVSRDWYTKFPYETPLSTTLSSPNQLKYTSAILNLIGKKNLRISNFGFGFSDLENPHVDANLEKNC